MTAVTLSSEFQVVIPENVRSKLNLQPGQKLVVIEKDGVVHLIPLRPIRVVRRIAKGIKAGRIRDEARTPERPLSRSSRP
jgi:AbrB family looped-hinge helix DNA binding protein